MFIIMVPAQSCHIWAPKADTGIQTSARAAAVHLNCRKDSCCSLPSSWAPASFLSVQDIGELQRGTNTEASVGQSPSQLSCQTGITAHHRLCSCPALTNSLSSLRTPKSSHVSCVLPGNCSKIRRSRQQMSHTACSFGTKSVRLTEILTDSLTSLRSDFTAAFSPKLPLGDDPTPGFCTTFSS